MRAALLALIFAAPLSAQFVNPPAPDTASLITFSFLGGCYGADPSVTVTGKAINFVVRDMPGIAGCVSAFVPYPLTFTFGPLPPGTYDLQSYGQTFTRLVVREATPFTVSPFAVPVTGGTLVRLERGGVQWPGFPRDTTVKVGNQLVKVEWPSDRLAFTAPPAPAGAVDITVDSRYYNDPRPNLYTAHSALIYYDPAQPPNQSIAEPVLFPIAFDGPGAYGSQWRTENSLRRFSPTPAYGVPVFFRPPCDGCATELPGKLTLPPMNRPEGFLVWVLRGSEQYLAATSRIRDVSRSESTAGVAVPVARGEDFRSSFVLPDVPIEPGSRAVLRLWSLENAPSVEVYVEGFIPLGGGSTLQVFKRITLARVSDQEMLFASSADFLATPFASPPGIPPGTTSKVDLTIRSALGLQTFWPMVSVTNNQTQQVTIVAPPR